MTWVDAYINYAIRIADRIWRTVQVSPYVALWGPRATDPWPFPPLAAGSLTACVMQGEFRQPMCLWDSFFTFDSCCATTSFEAAGQPCEHAHTTYANCCTAAAADHQPVTVDKIACFTTQTTSRWRGFVIARFDCFNFETRGSISLPSSLSLLTSITHTLL